MSNGPIRILVLLTFFQKATYSNFLSVKPSEKMTYNKDLVYSCQILFSANVATKELLLPHVWRMILQHWTALPSSNDSPPFFLEGPQKPANSTI
jgi:hypothetical protein